MSETANPFPDRPNPNRTMGYDVNARVVFDVACGRLPYDQYAWAIGSYFRYWADADYRRLYGLFNRMRRASAKFTPVDGFDGTNEEVCAMAFGRIPIRQRTLDVYFGAFPPREGARLRALFDEVSARSLRDHDDAHT